MEIKLFNNWIHQLILTFNKISNILKVNIVEIVSKAIQVKIIIPVNI